MHSSRHEFFSTPFVLSCSPFMPQIVDAQLFSNVLTVDIHRAKHNQKSPTHLLFVFISLWFDQSINISWTFSKHKNNENNMAIFDYFRMPPLNAFLRPFPPSFLDIDFFGCLAFLIYFGSFQTNELCTPPWPSFLEFFSSPFLLQPTVSIGNEG